MHRIDANAHVLNKFDEGDPGVPRQPTQVDADWLNAVQENICKAVEGAGLTLSKGTPETDGTYNNQLLQAIRQKGQTSPFYAICKAVDFRFASGGNLTLNESYNENDAYVSQDGSDTFAGVIPLPKGATITALEFLVCNDVTAANMTSVKAYLHDLPVVTPLSTNPLTTTQLQSNGSGETVALSYNATETPEYNAVTLGTGPFTTVSDMAFIRFVTTLPSGSGRKYWHVRATFTM